MSLTSYPEVNAVLEKLLPGVQAVLKDRFVGMYLAGSLAYGGFDRASDLDFVVVTAGELPAAAFSKLDEMHVRIAGMDSWCATQLEGTYVPLAALRHFDPVRALHVHIDRGPGERLTRMHIDDPGLSQAWWGGWVMLRATLYADGVTLAGPDPKTLVDPASPAELREATRANLEGWAARFLEDPARMHSRGYQSYVVLTLCRSLYTLRYGEMAPKRLAADWALTSLGERWHSLIDRAWAGRMDPDGPVDAADLQGTLDLIRYALAQEAGDETQDAGLPR